MTGEPERRPGWIENCGFAFTFQCPKSWAGLKFVGDERMRFCEACLKPVYRCDSPQELAERAAAGQCAAVFGPDDDADEWMGEISIEFG